MATLTDYKGIQVLTAPVTGPGGEAINDDLKILANRAPFPGATFPTNTDDASNGFYEGALWMETDDRKLWICTSATTNSATWEIVYERSSSALAIGGSDDVGIGTSTPSADLHLYRDDGNTMFYMESTNIPFIQMKQGFTDPDTYGTISLYTDGSMRLGAEANANTTQLAIATTGNVGMGTAAPGQNLHIKDSATDSNSMIATENDAQRWDFGTWANDFFLIRDQTDDLERFSIEKATGFVGCGTGNPNWNLHVKEDTEDNQCMMAFENKQSGSSEQFWVVGADFQGKFQIRDDTPVTAKVPVVIEKEADDNSLYIDGTGQVGIGTASPATKLHVTSAMTIDEQSSDPPDPAEGSAVLWMADGNGTNGDDGDIMMKITAGGTTKVAKLVDFSALP